MGWWIFRSMGLLWLCWFNTITFCWRMGSFNCGLSSWSSVGKFGDDGKPKAMPGHNIPLAAAGVLILWLGWFGFNGGSVLSADPELTSLTLVTTCLAAAAGGVTSSIVSNLLYKNYDLTMFMNGVLGGLVGITAGADQMSPTDAILIGIIAGVYNCFWNRSY